MSKNWGILTRNRVYMALWLSQIGSLFGDVIYDVAILVHVYNLTGSSLQVGMILICTFLPSLVVASVAGVFIDRWPRKPLMVASDLLRAAAVIGVLSATSLWQIYLLTFLLSSFGMVFTPAYSATVVTVLEKEQLQAANSFNVVTRRSLQLVLPVVSALLLGIWDLKVAFWVNAATFLLSGLIIQMLPIAAPVKRPPAEARRTGFWAEWLEGFQWARTNRMVWSVIWLSLILGLPTGVNNSLILAFAEKVLQVPPARFGYLMSSLTAGVLLGGVILSHLKPEFSVRLRSISLGLLAGGIAFALFGFNSNIYVAALLRCIMGIGFTVFNVSAFTTIQELTPDELRGRVFSFYNMVDESAMLLFLGVGGYIADLVGVRVPFLVAGAVTLMAAGYTYQALYRQEPWKRQTVTSGG